MSNKERNKYTYVNKMLKQRRRCKIMFTNVTTEDDRVLVTRVGQGCVSKNLVVPVIWEN